MAKSMAEDDEDLFLEEALARISCANKDALNCDLKSIMQKYSKQRVKTFVAISNLKDTSSKKQELTTLVDEMSVLFFQLGVKYGINKDPDLSDRLIRLEEKVEKVVSQPSYATAVRADKHDKVQTQSGKAFVPAPKKAIVITPIHDADGTKTCESTKKTLLSKIKPADLGIKPDRLLRNGKSGIRIEAKEIDTTKVNMDALKKAGLKMEVLGKWKPRLAVFGVPSDVDADTIKEEIMNIAVNGDAEDVSVKSKFGPREKHYNHWVIEVTPEIRKELLARERIYIGWSACSVKDHIRVIRCYKCQKYGHLQNDCKGDVACGHCAEDHDTRRCRNLNNPAKCYNCSKAGIRENGHEARSTKCQMYTRRTKAIISNTDYGQ